MEQYRAISGTRDVLPQERELWQRLEAIVREVMALYAYDEIVTPIFEQTELFARSIGEGTDIVSKEMYTFEDMGGRAIALRPEGTAGVVRAYLENSLGNQKPFQKLWYMGPIFRQERPQKGRQRQFHSFGVEAFGSDGPSVDAEVIALFMAIIKRGGVDGSLHVGSIGDNICRPGYIDTLRDYLSSIGDSLDNTSRERIKTNPLRVLDSKDEGTKEATKDAPSMLDHLCDGCKDHFRGLTEALERLDIPHTVDPRLVRGLDYYTRTVFEVRTDQLGSQDALGGGGRYDGLVEELGGPPTPAVGFGSGMERLVLLMDGADDSFESLDVFVATRGESAQRLSLIVLESLRDSGLKSDTDYLGRSLKAQLRQANRTGAKAAVILGDDELERGVAQVKWMDRDSQDEMPLDSLAAELSIALTSTDGQAGT